MAESGFGRFIITPISQRACNRNRINLTNFDTVSDGILYNRPKDPPGQRSHYIQPGATETEVYRITTFKNFPNHGPVDPMILAKYGFYFTGYKDRVKCFSCSLAVQDWSTNDNPRSTKWHFEDCNLVRGTETRNVQISKLVRRPLEFVRENTSSGVSSDYGYGSVDFSLYNNSFSSNSSQSSQSGSNGDVTNITTGLSGVNLSENNHSSSAPGAYQTATVTIPQKLGPYAIEGLDVSRIASEKFKKMLSTINLLTEEGRRKSFKIAIAPSDHFKSLNHELLAKSGFYYLGDHDRTQCFSCSGVLRNWRSNDVPDNEHKNHFPNCKLVNNNEPRNVPIGSELTIAQILKSPPNPSPEEQQCLNLLFPCTNPTTPNMSRYENRLRSFTSRWDKTKVKATIELIAEAGFFYLGDRDRAKCFYCNGGLQNWDPDDEPWTEHAKWFPSCEFILRSKGIEIAREMFLKYPDLPRLKIRNERHEYQLGFGTQSGSVALTPRMHDNRPTQSVEAVSLGLPAAPEPQAVANRVQHQNILNAAVPVSQIQRIKTQAMEMGFTSDAITKAIQNRAARSNGEYIEIQQLLDDLIMLPEIIEDFLPDYHGMAKNSQTTSTNQHQKQQTTTTNAFNFYGCDVTIGSKGMEFAREKNPNMPRLNVQNTGCNQPGYNASTQLGQMSQRERGNRATESIRAGLLAMPQPQVVTDRVCLQNL